ncbi:MAG TPA: DUF2130 domain-containing protein [Thermoanaerobaculia bacterium]|nr:DUF2130 domain-containing protein [Thermoanaerobaculia bacterium]
MEKEIATRFAAERRALDEEKAKLREVITLAKKQIEQADKQRLKEIAEVRKILEKDRQDALLKKEAAFARERDAFHKRISEMSRQIEKKSSREPGEGSELDLFDELRAAFPDDETSRTKGRAAGDILHEVRYKGASCGRILIDSRRRAAWQHAFVTKLRQDQTDVGADYAILATAVFPTGKRELFVDSGVLVAAPARVPVIIDVLRKALISMHVAKLSDAERTDKMSRLFKFITSAAFKQKLAEAEALTREALDIDVEEQRAHQNVWKRRGTLMTRIRNVLREINTDVGAIVEAREGGTVVGIRSNITRVH